MLILPDSDLWALPWAALLDECSKHLIETHLLSVAPSVSAMLKPERQTADAAQCDIVRAVIVGDADYHGRMPKQKGSRKEAREVWGVFDGPLKDNAVKLFGNDAKTKQPMSTKQRVLEALDGNTVYAHFATYSTPDGVFLSGESETEGKLMHG